jgi:hypothetical protein
MAATNVWMCMAAGAMRPVISANIFLTLLTTNFMSPQQTPMVVWSMVNSIETTRDLIKNIKGNAAFTEEALYGADYLMRSLSPEDYFYMTIFSYFKKDPEERRIVGC